MLASVYLFGELGTGYTQYLDDYTKDIFKEFAKKTKANTQLLIHREDNTIYYVYIRRLHGNKYIGMCYVVSGVLITAYEQLFDIFERTLDTIVTRGKILEFTVDGRITSSLENLYQCKAEFAQVADYLKMQFDHIEGSHIKQLPPVNYAINSSESRTYNITASLDEISNAIGVYSYVYILKDKDYESDALKSYSSILRSLNKKIKELEVKNSTNYKRAIKAESAQRNTKWVAILSVAAIILGIVVWNNVLFPSEVTKKEMGQFVYYGPMENGQPNGVGVAIYHENDVDGRLYYYGNFTDGKRIDNDAIMFYKDGSYFKGSMNEDKWFKGLFFDVEKEHFIGEFKENSPWNGEWYRHVKEQTIRDGR